jgi:hypothetical protein
MLACDFLTVETMGLTESTSAAGPDVRGYGESTRPTHDPTLQAGRWRFSSDQAEG